MHLNHSAFACLSIPTFDEKKGRGRKMKKKEKRNQERKRVGGKRKRGRDINEGNLRVSFEMITVGLDGKEWKKERRGKVKRSNAKTGKK